MAILWQLFGPSSPNNLVEDDMKLNQLSAVALFVLGLSSLPAQDTDEVFARISKEAQNSQAMRLAQGTVYNQGPRTTGSTDAYNAAEFIRSEYDKFGLNPKHSKWEGFGTSWSWQKSEITLNREVLASVPYPWSPPTPHPLHGKLVYAPFPPVPDMSKLEEVFNNYFNQYRGKLQGSIVLLTTAKATPEDEKTADIFSDKVLSQLSLQAKPCPDIVPPYPNPQSTNEDFLRCLVAKATISTREHLDRTNRQLTLRILKFLKEEGVLVGIRMNRKPGNVFYPPNVSSRLEEFALPFPQVILEQSAYLRLCAEPQSKASVVVESQFLSNAPTFNTFGEIPGTSDQTVMIGAHLDSIPYGEGAVDNGGNVATVMEAMRILKTLGVQPKHSIVSAFWTGEEQHLLGSRAYIQAHKKDLGNLKWYFNLDSGIGKIRGLNTFGRNIPHPTLEAWIRLFETKNNAWLLQQRHGTGISDDESFHEAGVRSLEFVQDPAGYEQVAHSSADTFSLLNQKNMSHNAVYVAWIIWQAANE